MTSYRLEKTVCSCFVSVYWCRKILSTYQSTRRHIPEDLNLYHHQCENLQNRNCTQFTLAVIFKLYKRKLTSTTRLKPVLTFQKYVVSPLQNKCFVLRKPLCIMQTKKNQQIFFQQYREIYKFKAQGIIFLTALWIPQLPKKNIQATKLNGATHHSTIVPYAGRHRTQISDCKPAILSH